MRIPLHIKLMASYLLVVGLVLIPTAVYLRTTLTRDQHARARAELETQLAALCARLAEAPPERLVERTDLLLTALPTRLTVIDPAGRVIGDSYQPAVRMDNHANRPEVRDAFRGGTGVALRRSGTTGQVMLYVAMRFPREGSVRGVARLSQSEAAINAASEQASLVVRNASAGALSVAVLLSLVAALAASRPLRRIAEGARAFAAGDFGASVDVRSNDEIGEVAEALAALSSQLRAKLLTAGADRATLQALLDDLPVGVVLYDAQRVPVAVNGAARELCGLPPHAEVERGAEIPRLEGQAAAIQRSLGDGLTVEVPLALPWRPDAALVARWVVVFAADGSRLPGLVVVDRADARAREALGRSLTALASHLRAALGGSVDRARACGDLLRAEELVPLPDPAAEGVTPTTLRALYEGAVADVGPVADAAGVSFALEAADASVRLAELDGRARRALRTILWWAADRSAREGEVTVTATAREGSVLLSVHAPRSAAPTAPDVGSLVRPIGGDAGVSAHDEGVDCWISVPRA